MEVAGRRAAGLQASYGSWIRSFAPTPMFSSSAGWDLKKLNPNKQVSAVEISICREGRRPRPPGRGGGAVAVRGEGRLEAVQRSPDLFHVGAVDLGSFGGDLSWDLVSFFDYALVLGGLVSSSLFFATTLSSSLYA